MSRKYANIMTSIWRDRDFRSLPSGSQRAYLMLVTQPDITAAGTLPLTLGRWAANAPDTTADSLRADFGPLLRRRFIVVDERLEEVLVRSFVKWDGGFNNPKRRPSIKEAAQSVASPAVREALAVEFSRLGLPSEWLSDTESDDAEDIDDHSEIVPTYGQTESGEGARDAKPVDNAFAQANSLSDSQGDSHAPEQRVVGDQGEWVSTTTHNPQSSSRSAPPNGHRRARLIIRSAATAATDDEITKMMIGIASRYAVENLGDYLHGIPDDQRAALLADELDRTRQVAADLAESYAGPRCPSFNADDSGVWCLECKHHQEHAIHKDAA